MDKVIGLIIGVSVLLVAAVVVTAIFSGEFGEFGRTVDEKKKAGCKFQAKNADSYEDLSPECQKLKNDPEIISCLKGETC